jgi:hypothetical protein
VHRFSNGFGVLSLLGFSVNSICVGCGINISTFNKTAAKAANLSLSPNEFLICGYGVIFDNGNIIIFD